MVFDTPTLSASSEIARATAVLTLARSTKRWPKGAVAEVALLGHNDPSPTVRAAAVAALVERANPTRAFSAWAEARTDDAVVVRRRANGLAVTLASRASERTEAIIELLVQSIGDADDLCAESACFALGEVAVDHPLTLMCVEHLAATATSHPEPLVREAAVAALGAIGHTSGRAAVLQACTDKPAIRRRAVLALVAFDGPEVQAALARALTDADWQVRQAAEDLLG